MLAGVSASSLLASFRASARLTAGYWPMFVRSRPRPRITNHVLRFFLTRIAKAGVDSSKYVPGSFKRATT